MTFTHMQESNYSKLDELAKTNAVAKDRQLGELENIVRKSGNFFDYVTEAKVKAIANRLQVNGIGCVQARDAMNKVVNSFDRFPSYKAIYELCSANIENVKVECTRCHGGGLLSLYEIKSGRNFAFSCECLNGMSYTKIKSIKYINLNQYTNKPPSFVNGKPYNITQ